MFSVLLTYNSVVESGIDKVVKDCDVKSTYDQTFSSSTCFIEWLPHTTEIIVEHSTMNLVWERREWQDIKTPVNNEKH